eukprot:14308328-Ditylum_brightwellii.AAC.1
MGHLPFATKTIPYNDLDDNQKKTVDDYMPFIHGFEADGSGDHNFNHLQNFLARIGFFVLSRVDKLVTYRSAAGHSYLNTIEWVISIANIGLANHATELDPTTPHFLLDILQHLGTMQQVQNNIKEYDDVRKEAIKFVEQ